MKRSEINAAIAHAMRMLGDNSIGLPEFGWWKADEWRARRKKVGNIRKVMLGWDVTDFGSGDFLKRGAVLFTVRNGSKREPEAGVPYAEKLIFMRHETEQEIPLHFHTEKTEDIINRGGGILMLQLYNANADDSLDEKNEVRVRMDGVDHVFPPGAFVEVEKGRSITLIPRLYHRFWAKKGFGDLIVGEVSSVNDDAADNTFLNGAPRFILVDEDEDITYPLCNEYDAILTD